MQVGRLQEVPTSGSPVPPHKIEANLIKNWKSNKFSLTAQELTDKLLSVTNYEF